MSFKKGDTVKCIDSRGQSRLKEGSYYLVLKDQEEGILIPLPYVTIMSEWGQVVCHAQRFIMEF